MAENSKEDNVRQASGVSKKPKKKTYKEMMAEILKPKENKVKKVNGVGGGRFEKVVQI